MVKRWISVDEVMVIELSDVGLGKHARAQLREYFEEIKKKEAEDVLEIPLMVEKALDENSGCIILIDSTDQQFMEEVVSKVLDIETNKRKPVQKLIVNKESESENMFKRRVQEAARENAEKLAAKISRKGSNPDYRENIN